MLKNDTLTAFNQFYMPRLQEGLAGNIREAHDLLAQTGSGAEVTMLLGESINDDAPSDAEVVRQMESIGARIEVIESYMPTSRMDCARVYRLRLLSLMDQVQ